MPVSVAFAAADACRVAVGVTARRVHVCRGGVMVRIQPVRAQNSKTKLKTRGKPLALRRGRAYPHRARLPGRSTGLPTRPDRKHETQNRAHDIYTKTVIAAGACVRVCP